MIPTVLRRRALSRSPTFGAINLEDIKAPDCFAIEHNLRA